MSYSDGSRPGWQQFAAHHVLPPDDKAKVSPVAELKASRRVSQYQPVNETYKEGRIDQLRTVKMQTLTEGLLWMYFWSDS